MVKITYTYPGGNQETRTTTTDTWCAPDEYNRLHKTTILLSKGSPANAAAIPDNGRLEMEAED